MTDDAAEVQELIERDDIPDRSTYPAGADVVRAAISSLDGGINGVNPFLVLGIKDAGDGSLTYTLTDREDGAVETFHVTIQPVPNPE